MAAHYVATVDLIRYNYLSVSILYPVIGAASKV